MLYFFEFTKDDEQLDTPTIFQLLLTSCEFESYHDIHTSSTDSSLLIQLSKYLGDSINNVASRGEPSSVLSKIS